MIHTHLKSKVGRRLFLRFLLAALLPVGGLAIYAYAQVVDTLTASNEQRLRQDSKSLGMNLLRELNWRTRLLQQYPDDVLPGNAEGRKLPEGFSHLDLLPKGMTITVDQARHLGRGEPVLRFPRSGDVGILFSPEGSARVLFATIDPHVLWINDQASEHYCVFAMDFWVHFCTPEMQPPSPQALSAIVEGRNAGTLQWVSDMRRFAGGFWQARLDAAYAHPGFIVLVGESLQAHEKNLAHFKSIFFATTALGFGLALLLASSQIRRQMIPLERLTEGTRRLAAGDFSAQPDVLGEDEFASLGKSFNHMSENLRHKFHMLQMLGELDRAILRASEMDYIIQTVLLHVRRSIPCDGAGIIRIDACGDNSLLLADAPEGGASLRARNLPETLLVRAAPGERTEKGRGPGGSKPSVIDLTRDDVNALLPEDAVQPWYLVEWRENGPDWPGHISDSPIKHIVVFPVRVNERLDSLLILGYEDRPEDLGEIAEAGCNLTDRLAVACSNIAWEERLYHQGHYDALTDLPNRVLLRDRAEQAILRADREHGAVAVMLVDLDNFKQINDGLGHSAGDVFLVECARRLKDLVRQSDTVARLGGDEFTLLISLADRENASGQIVTLARKVNAALAEPAEVGGRRVTSPASVGIALYPEHASCFEDLLKMADAAMYESKRHFPGSYRFCSGEMNEEVRVRFEMTQDLREALGKDELILYYQPKVSATTGHIVGAEALLRWQSPKRGLVPPGLFIPLIDAIGMGNWLGEWVVDRACAQMAEWDRIGLASVPVSVNISPIQFRESDIIATVEDALHRYALASARLELEILEDTAASDSPEIHATLTRLRAMGVGIALDDFGSGYSSLSNLTQLPANVLKLDRAFICNLGSDLRQQAIVGGIISLAQSLYLQVVAEGVEDQQQLSLLAGMGCDLIQGYLFSRPVPPDEFAEMLRAGNRQAYQWSN